MRKIKQIEYQVRHGVVCITPCPHIPADNGRPMIGSVRCKSCSYFQDCDSVNHIVTCSHTYVSPRKNRDYSKMSTKKRRVRCITTGIEYVSVREAARDYGLNSSTISKAIREQRPVKTNYLFEYL